MNPQDDAFNLLAQVKGFAFSRIQFLYFCRTSVEEGAPAIWTGPGWRRTPCEFTPLVAGISPS